MKNTIYFLLFCITLTSCLNSDESTDFESFEPQTEQDIINYIEANNLTATKTDSGLYYIIDEEGTGDTPSTDSDVTIVFDAFLLNGTLYSQTDDDGIAVEVSQQIEGFQEGLQLLKEGGEGTLIIPTELAFNDGVVLVVDVKLIDVIDNEADILAYIDDNNLNASRTDSGLYYVINEEGTGNTPTETSNVTVAYKGYLLDGTVFDESDANGIDFDLDGVILGWTEGIQLFKEGGEGILLIPNDLAYGLLGVSSIPGGAVIVFDINLISVNN
ncbi:FKBP-type peptidyl-prolyl cis-trans isomerase [Polaribacter sp.]|nr:FKBP-type peptidyl-prolyl cis-trans isomerase [Polaribacter sp.]